MGNEHWHKTTLSCITQHPQYGWTSKASQRGTYKYFRTTDIKTPVNWDGVPYCEVLPPDPDKFTIKRDDLLVSRAGSVGLSIRINEDYPLVIFASYLIRVRPLDCVMPKFLEYYFQSHEYWSYIGKTQTGIAVPNVNATKLSELPLLLPPIEEQQQIVEKLDAILPKVRNAKERLEKIPVLLKKFRQSILSAACSGKLTEDWRKSLKDSAIDSYNKCEKTRSKRKRVLEIDEQYIQLNIPDTWHKTNIDNISDEVVDCPHSTPKWTTTGKVCLRTTNFFTNKLNLNEVKFVSEESFQNRIARLKPQKGDVLYSREGGILGIACVLDIDDDVCLGQRMMMFRCNSNVSNRFICYYLNSPIINHHVHLLTGGSAAPHINVGDIKMYPVPLPSLKEQNEIVMRIDKLFALADSLEAKYKKTMARIEKVEQSVLAKAFRGELAYPQPSIQL